MAALSTFGWEQRFSREQLLSTLLAHSTGLQVHCHLGCFFFSFLGAINSIPPLQSNSPAIQSIHLQWIATCSKCNTINFSIPTLQQWRATISGALFLLYPPYKSSSKSSCKHHPNTVLKNALPAMPCLPNPAGCVICEHATYNLACQKTLPSLTMSTACCACCLHLRATPCIHPTIHHPPNNHWVALLCLQVCGFLPNKIHNDCVYHFAYV